MQKALMKPVICIAGPTASGKSAWSVELAHKLDGEIINADSMQVYADLQILSARPRKGEMQGVPHHLFGHVDGAVRYSTGEWVREAVPIILDCLARDKVPILVGGTGLYYKALTEGIASVPEPSQEAKQKSRDILSKNINNLRETAERLDPVAAARVLGDDPQRLLRIVEVALGTDKCLSDWQKETRPIIPKGYWYGAVLMPEREVLYDRINKRFEMMVEQGGMEEAKSVAKRGLSEDLPMMKAIGVMPLIQHLRGEISRERALELAQRDTRRFSKRQYTWFRGQAKNWHFIMKNDDKYAFEANIEQIMV